MDLESITSAQYVRERQMLYITYIHLKYKKIQIEKIIQMNLHNNRNTLTDIEKLMVPEGEMEERKEKLGATG